MNHDEIRSLSRNFPWDAGYNVINQSYQPFGSSESLSSTYVHNPQKQVGSILADLAGTNPASGTARYYFQDNIGSTRRLRDTSKNSLYQYEYTPYGEDYASSGSSSTNYRFTGKEWDATSGLYYFPYRYYNPSISRWLTRDPLGMVDGPNVYAYLKGSPISGKDARGAQGEPEGEDCYAQLKDCVERIEGSPTPLDDLIDCLDEYLDCLQNNPPPPPPDPVRYTPPELGDWFERQFDFDFHFEPMPCFEVPVWTNSLAN